MNSWKSLRDAGWGAAGVAVSLLLLANTVDALPASAGTVQVVVNGQHMNFDQPPIERGGRVFVPVRGVFEKLGASVAYEHGFINAVGTGGQTVALTVGSRHAVVDGKTTTLDVAPFTSGARTLVPLRFVSTALGAAVNYAADRQVVSISNQAAAPAKKSNTSWILPALGAVAVIAVLTGSHHHSSSVSLNNVSPASGSVASSTRPSISGDFSAAVDPNSIAVAVDGNDQSDAAYVSPNNFSFTPTYDLRSGQHTVRVTGRSQNSATFDQSWSFWTPTNGRYRGYNPNNPYSPNGSNFVNSVYPQDGSTVGGSFTINGNTVPNARVTLAVTSGGRGIFGIGTHTDNYATFADGSGRFYQNISVANGSGDVRVRITSTAPYTSASTGTNLTYHT